MLNYALLGRRIARMRKEAKITQEKLAEMADISNNYLSNIENNYSIPSLETFMKICSALETTPDKLLLGIDSVNISYLDSEISDKIKSCTPKEKRLINGIIDLVIRSR